MKAIYPGSFDPVTKGHLDIILRSLAVVDELLVAIMDNPAKPGFFTAGERKKLLETACAELGLERVKVIIDRGLLVDLARKKKVGLIIRGVRNTADLDSESAMARANRRMHPGLETIFLPASGDTADISSTLIRQIAALGGDASHFVPPCVLEALRLKNTENN